MSDRATLETLFARARNLAPRLAQRAQAAEQARSAPAETMADYHESGLLRLCQPLRYGGFELGWDALCEISQILAAGDGAQAWIQCIMADHAQLVSLFGPAAQEEVWGNNHRAAISASFEPTGKARRQGDGFLFSGKHGFASGIDHADWLVCGGFLVDGEQRSGPHFFLVPKSAARIVDDWDVMGLEGTGSKSFIVEEAYIPAHRMLDGDAARAGTSPGAMANPAAVYRLPRGGVTATGFAALAIGMSRGLLQSWLRHTATRLSRGVPVAKQPGAQAIVARSTAEIDAGEALYLGSLRRAMVTLAAGGMLDEFAIATVRRDASFACRLAVKAGTRLFNQAGGRALFNAQAMSRQYRNLVGGTLHVSIAWDTSAPAYGAALLERQGTE